MCGIAGYIGTVNWHQTICKEKVIRVINHRGPDGCGSATVNGRSGNAFFAHTRLSIIDTSSSGGQPMAAGDDAAGSTVTIIFNGEIFNYRELRRELVGLGFQCLGG